jgi:hypothetical protein
MWIHDFPYCCGGRRKKSIPWLLLPIVLYKAFLQGNEEVIRLKEFIWEPLGRAKVPAMVITAEESITLYHVNNTTLGSTSSLSSVTDKTNS